MNFHKTTGNRRIANRSVQLLIIMTVGEINFLELCDLLFRSVSIYLKMEIKLFSTLLFGYDERNQTNLSN